MPWTREERWARFWRRRFSGTEIGIEFSAEGTNRACLRRLFEGATFPYMELLARLGLFLYGLSWLIAVPLIGLLLIGWASGDMAEGTQYLVGGAAIIALGLGRAVYYVLAGR